MRAFTIWQPWASMIIAGVKPYEFRRWAAPRHLWGQRIVIHAGARPVRTRELAQLINQLGDGEDIGLEPRAMDLLDRWWRREAELPTASGLGTAVLGEPRRAVDIYAGRPDSDRVDEHVWGWPLTDSQPFTPIGPCRGLQGFWTWPQGAA
ncbi:hypothetical protein FHP25_24785 [Vineibacter terrae]|uniref:ASCH domain-containing protein n=1 Tax=Vineibacter terrae TaxID=2586908 RepID=A0A5C8PFS8_9HYPH|nr:hypothetical protein [Vineibacter terrae]TXL72515.1 hypothetical protein FHP25_24785 [Vineibacter terrae]